nr:MAG TPA: hypothetical protein [Microviridae sp.]
MCAFVLFLCASFRVQETTTQPLTLIGRTNLRGRFMRGA